MQQYHWRDCPAQVRSQVEQFVQGVQDVPGDNLIGVYLHGSLAMGCFNPQRSDLDLLVIIKSGMSDAARHAMATLLLEKSANPCPIEMSIVTHAQLHPWQYPTSFDFHYSEDYRERFAQGDYTFPVSADPDLAAHITIIKHRGVCLYGAPIEGVFPAVPPRDYQHSILLDFEEARRHVDSNPVYTILNMCRVYWYLLEKTICSKAEAGLWAVETLPQPYLPAVQQALEVYRGERSAIDIDNHALRNFVTYLTLRVNQLVMIEKRQHGGK